MVVDSHQVGMKLVGHLNQHKKGRVTFMPLDKLDVPQPTYPKQYGQDAVPLHKMLVYDPKFDKAVRQVFGRTMVCRSRAIAEEVAAGGELDGITMEGDLVRRKGTISGGYSNASRSKYKLFREVRLPGVAW
jgi:structural maintenance of chromosome 3 (chondroitin sulfate proteoglycan 6)